MYCKIIFSTNKEIDDIYNKTLYDLTAYYKKGKKWFGEVYLEVDDIQEEIEAEKELFLEDEIKYKIENVYVDKYYEISC